MLQFNEFIFHNRHTTPVTNILSSKLRVTNMDDDPFILGNNKTININV